MLELFLLAELASAPGMVLERKTPHFVSLEALVLAFWVVEASAGTAVASVLDLSLPH